jgi:hypothetical protein
MLGDWAFYGQSSEVVRCVASGVVLRRGGWERHADLQLQCMETMKSNLVSSRRLGAGSIILAVALIFLQSTSVCAQVDDFDDGNDEGWTRFNPLTVVGAGATWSFPGGAYRLEAPAPPVPNAGPARAFTYRAEARYTNFFAAVDILAWNNDVNQAFGILGRGDHIGPGTTQGYVCNYNPNQSSGQPGGQFQINRATGEAEDGTLASANVTLEAGRTYRMVFMGVGSTLVGKLYDLEDLTRPIATIIAHGNEDDRVATYPDGYCGLFVFFRGGSAQWAESTSLADATFDNYMAAVTAPETVAEPGTPHGVVGMLQAINRVPVSYASFYPAGDGLEFNVSTLTSNEINVESVRLILNGRDVSSSLDIEGLSNQLQVRYGGLQPNRIFDARIELEDSQGRQSIQAWTFDTLTEEFLAAAPVVVIEAEDYNYELGQFQNYPPASGLNSAGIQVRGHGEGYFDALGGPDIDYSKAAHQFGAGVEPVYRLEDFVGTQAGSVELQPGAILINDHRRQKYIVDDLPEYQVRRTEAGDWLNYTRTFAPGQYHVYLRVASKARQDILLDRVTGDPTFLDQTTAPLGVFQVPNLGMNSIYRHVPLTDDNGNRLTLDLSATQTLRLTMGGEVGEFATRWTKALNYLLVLPVVDEPPQAVRLGNPQLDPTGFRVSFPSEQGRAYTLETSNRLDMPGSWTTADTATGDGQPIELTDPAPSGDVRFYRVRAE